MTDAEAAATASVGRMPDPLARLAAAFDRFDEDGDVGELLATCVMEGWLSGQIAGGDHWPLVRLCRERGANG